MDERTPTKKMEDLLESYKGISQVRKDEILALFVEHLPKDIRAIYPSDSRGCVVETVEAYGLLIDVDANGRAARVALPDAERGIGTTASLDPEWWIEEA